MTRRFEILRPDDLVALTVRAVNLELDTSQPGQPRLVREAADQPVYLVFELAPQHVVEQAFFESAQVTDPPFNPPPGAPPTGEPPQAPPVGGLPAPGDAGRRMAGTSRLVFSVPKTVTSLPYSIAGLLDWTKLELALPPAANVPPGASHAKNRPPPPIVEPGDLETALEVPYRLFLAPNVAPGAQPAWVHAPTPVVHAGRAELWHTRLGQRRHGTFTEASRHDAVPVRVVWSPDFVDNGPIPTHATDETPFRAPMSERDRDQIVILSAGFSGYTLTDQTSSRPYVPTPLGADRLFLSTLGAWLTSRGSWPYPVTYQFLPFLPIGPIEHARNAPGRLLGPPGVLDPPVALPAPDSPVRPLPTETAALDLIEWDHVATQGRDHYVRIVYAGFLYPFGHRATLVKVTERKVHAPHGDAGNATDDPVAYLRQRMYIVVREREKAYTGEPYVFAGREMPFAASVRIETAVTPEIDQPPPADSFFVNVGSDPFPFHVSARDLAGSTIDFHAPLMFVSISEPDIGGVIATYRSDNDRRRAAVKGKKVAYADPAAGDTVLKTNGLYFSAQQTGAGPPYPVAPFIPIFDQASVTVDAVSQLVGSQVAVTIALYGPYLDAGLDPNAGVFAQIVGTPPPVGFSADKSGGFARPNIALSALSARKGLVSGDPADAKDGLIDPTAYFGDIDAKLFGTIDLGRLIPLDDIAHPGKADAGQNAPEIRTKAKPNHKHPTTLSTVITWEPRLHNFDEDPIRIHFDVGGQSTLKLHVEIVDRLDGNPPTSDATGKLSNFSLELLEIIALKVKSIDFESKNGAKSTVKLHLADKDPIGFEGPLQFIQQLADILPPGLFGGSGPSIKLTSTALKVSYTLALPPITCGVFSLEHISITAGLDLPYLDGKPAIEFAFAKRNRPFLLTVEIFGGGGFVHVVLDADGVQMVEGSLEFGANFSLDIGVASGAVHAMAGIYFQLKGDSSELTGFIDIGGEVSVLGIISISIDLNLSLSWLSSPAGNVIRGRATLTVSVHVLFFSASVELSVERSFDAGGGDPKVNELMTAAQWSDYALAFA